MIDNRVQHTISRNIKHCYGINIVYCVYHVGIPILGIDYVYIKVPFKVYEQTICLQFRLYIQYKNQQTGPIYRFFSLGSANIVLI